jgi:pyrroline-5-carboxylate reductase
MAATEERAEIDLLIVGGGNMGEALVAGLLAQGSRSLAVLEPSAERRTALEAAYPGLRTSDGPVPAAAAVIAVKPHHVEDACRSVVASGARRVLSIAAGVTTASLETWLPAEVAVIRSMPNTPAQVGAGASAISVGSRAGDADLAWAEEILGSVGVVVRVPEELLDAVTGLSGSGPAYVFALVEAMAGAGAAAGLPPEVAAALARQTVVGAGRLLEQSSESPAALREAVTSPGGTTAAGLAVLTAQLNDLLEATVAAAAARSKELGA